MKFTSLAVTLLASALPAIAKTGSLTYDPTYDDASLSLSSVACSDGVNGLLRKGYATLGSLPTFPRLGGVYAVAGWDSAACGTCYNVTYGNTTISVLAVDTTGAGDDFNLSEGAMNALTDNLAVDLGRVQVTSVQVKVSDCGIH